ncbi:MAG: ABC transporter ATP-binding protein/permease [Solobacterium sp.]|nr:ABC transporter ATP-binding protein/permease [Solobacterium sp.]MDY5402213.1 ABC transporter ATP-binding protein/permease [Erysipelotrichaceae bacterium]
MLQIKNISKTYKTGNFIQKALNEVSLNLRDNEFVAILGPSGSGKTTLLNIIGGLDKYDSGDLIINGISTKNYKDKQWDTYRNHTIGFIFQSYNLIPHQTILSNVELALTIAGISKKEKTKLALDALDKVGLKEQAHKKPNQLSGGQMQRVAIARALVNNPSIVLADEPTGALDTKTSIQVMDLLKEVAKDRLVVMVTHNPELAKKYANRIVNLKDGVIIDDTNPYKGLESGSNPGLNLMGSNLPPAHMSFLTALSLSFNNLLSKKGRTILTAFAGSIGIIGISLILALSTGFQNYIDKIQDDTMSSYPLTIQSETTNVFTALLQAHVPNDKEEADDGLVHEQLMISSMMDSVGSNDLKSFISYLNDNENLYKDDVKKISYAYSITPRIYTKDITDTIVQLNPSTLMSSIYSDSAASLLSSMSAANAMGIFVESDKETLESNTNLIKGRYPEKYNEVMLVLKDKDKIPDLLVYSLGLRDNKVLNQLVNDIMTNHESDIKDEAKTFTYDELINRQLKLINTSDLYRYNSKYDTYEDMSNDKEYLEDIYNKSEGLIITGVAYSNDNSSLTGIIYYDSLVDHVIDIAKDSPLVKKQLSNPDIDVFSGNKFDEDKEKSGLNFNDMVSIDQDKLKNAFKFNLDTSAIRDTDYASIILNNSNDIKETITSTTDSFVGVINNTYKSFGTTLIDSYNKMFTQTVTIATSCPNDNYVDVTDPSKGCIFNEGDDYVEINSYKYVPNNYISTSYVYYGEYSPLDPNVKTVDFFINTFDSNGDFNNSIDLVCQNLKDKTYINLTKDDIKNIAYEMFRTYFDEIRKNGNFDSTTNLIKADDLIDVDTVENTVLTNSASSIYGQAYNSAKELINMLAAKGVASAVQESTTPLIKVFEGMDKAITFDTQAFSSAFNFDMDEDELSRLMSSMLTSSSASYKNNLINLGYQDKEEPTSISFYFNDFESKDNFQNLIDTYNQQVKDEYKDISYTDMTGLLMSSVSTIINAVTYVLIAFVSISLIVSSIMIAVITLISVMERTKEIGILRAMGASKHNVSSIFNAETFIIGLLSGFIGVGISSLLTIPINNLIHKLTDVYDINAVLNLKPALILVLISVLLTMLTGFIPSKKAAKQDPVKALRSE